jgi:hypothetical protein
MVKYSIEIKPQNNQPEKKLAYTLDLNFAQENNPEIIFTPEIRESMIRYLENKNGYKVSHKNLEYIINFWLADIRNGYRETSLSIRLPLLIDSQIYQVIESGYQEIPDLIEPDLSTIEPQGGAFPPLTFSIK